MKKVGIVAVLSMLALGALITGCGNSASTSTCDYKLAGVHECTVTDYSADTTGLAAGLADSACKSEGGTTTCATANVLGTCATKVGTYTETVTYYSDSTPALTADQAKMACGAGTWTAK